jgi:hypothetical protein
MPKEFKPGWEYMYSGALKQEIAVHIKTGRIYCEDKTQYSLRELEIMKGAQLEITPQIHLAKKLFEGEIVNVIHKEKQIKDGELFDIF